jgi:hypothetical protein
LTLALSHYGFYAPRLPAFERVKLHCVGIGLFLSRRFVEPYSGLWASLVGVTMSRMLGENGSPGPCAVLQFTLPG